MFIFCGFAQNDKIDSLKKLIRINDEDTNQVALLKELCRENRKIGEFEKAFQFGKSAIDLGKKNYKPKNTYWCSFGY